MYKYVCNVSLAVVSRVVVSALALLFVCSLQYRIPRGGVDLSDAMYVLWSEVVTTAPLHVTSATGDFSQTPDCYFCM